MGVFGVLALQPFLSTTGSSASYWEWFIPPLVAALIALGVRATLGRGFAIPFYAVALVGLVIGQVRLFIGVSIPVSEYLVSRRLYGSHSFSDYWESWRRPWKINGGLHRSPLTAG